LPLGAQDRDGDGDLASDFLLIAESARNGMRQSLLILNVPDKVDEDDVACPIADADANGESTFRVQKKRRRGRANPATLCFASCHETLLFEGADDHGNRLSGKACFLADLQACRYVVLQKQRQHQAFVVASHTQ
jgi:hypothetical protein